MSKKLTKKEIMLRLCDCLIIPRVKASTVNLAEYIKYHHEASKVLELAKNILMHILEPESEFGDYDPLEDAMVGLAELEALYKTYKEGWT